jgi:AbiV family abortive infection protein
MPLDQSLFDQVCAAFRGFRRPRRPSPADLLYTHLLRDKAESGVLDLISEGCRVILGNAERLVVDVECLSRGGGFASAGFLAATVEEEVAKVLLLLDLAKLDFVRRNNYAKNICTAFCDHTAKAARFLVFQQWPRLRSIREARRIIAEARIEWFPGELNGEVPDLANDAYYRREANLYADIDWTTGHWVSPENKSAADYFGLESGASSSRWSETLVSLSRFAWCRDRGLFDGPAIEVVHRAYMPVFVGEDADSAVSRVAKGVIEYIGDTTRCGDDQLDRATPLSSAPMYAFILEPLE